MQCTYAVSVCASRTLFCSASAAYVTRMRQVFSCVCFALPRMRCTGSAFLSRTVTQFHAYAYTLVTGFKHVAPFWGENSWIILSLCRHTTYCGHVEARPGLLGEAHCLVYSRCALLCITFSAGNLLGTSVSAAALAQAAARSEYGGY